MIIQKYTVYNKKIKLPEIDGRWEVARLHTGILSTSRK